MSMRDWSGGRGFSRRQVLAAGTAVPVGGLFWIGALSARAQVTAEAAGRGLQVDVEAVDTAQAELNAVAAALRSSAGPALGGEAHPRARNLRVISVMKVDPEENGKPVAERAPSARRWRARVYDYDNQRALVLEGPLGNVRPDRVFETKEVLIPSWEEWAEARDLLLRHPDIGPRLRAGKLIATRPMPPCMKGGRNGRHRLVTVGLLPVLPRRLDETYEIVAADLAERSVQRFAARAPVGAVARGSVCGAPPAAGQDSTGQGFPGQYNLTIRSGSTVYWTLTIVRPSSSSGLRGSGIELRDVVYRGRKVLKRAHVPILNVKYDRDVCGPYRDWLYEEGMLQASGTDVAPGFRRASSAPRTILQSGTDTGNFLGTAVWVNGDEVTLMAELEAGWYRYLSQWTLSIDGTIRPRFGFAAVADSCVCNIHHHHAYWRLDFDIGSPNGNFVQQLDGGTWRTVPNETMVFRDAAFARRWRVGNRNLRAMYEIRPNTTDGRARASQDWPFPAGDLWLLRYRPGEIDDGVNIVQGAAQARLNRFVNGESINGADVVVWYAAHFTHDKGATQEPGGDGHVVGPDLVPVSW